jgi:hypothetical protein
MTQEQINNILLVGKFMGVENLFTYQGKKDIEPLGVYMAEDEEGRIDYVDVGINWYSPDKDWNTLMDVCKKIIGMYFDKRQDIFTGLQTCDIDATFKACVEFIKFWYDDTQEKLTWNNQVTPIAPATTIEIMKVIDAKNIDGNPRAKVRGGTYITFLSKDTIDKGTYVDIVVENKTHHFEVSSVEIKGDYLSIDAREVGYWARKIEKKDNFDLRTLLGIDVTVVTDEKEKQQIYTESCWC